MSDHNATIRREVVATAFSDHALTNVQRHRAIDSLERMKALSIETGKLHFVLISFEGGDMIFSESNRMPRSKEKM